MSQNLEEMSQDYIFPTGKAAPTNVFPIDLKEQLTFYLPTTVYIRNSLMESWEFPLVRGQAQTLHD